MKKIKNLSEGSFLKLLFGFLSLCFLVAAFCMAAFALAFFLPKSIAKLGKEDGEQS